VRAAKTRVYLHNQLALPDIKATTSDTSLLINWKKKLNEFN
jgi:hypothetical protein